MKDKPTDSAVSGRPLCRESHHVSCDHKALKSGGRRKEVDVKISFDGWV
jgi:hypothetical protein